MNERRATLSIDGMSCGHCVAAVTGALEGLDGVRIEDVEIGEARVAYDEDVVSPEEMKMALGAVGYDASAEIEPEAGAGR